MDYETADGSHFSLQEVFAEQDGIPVFQYTSIAAFVDGKAFAARTEQRADEIDEADIFSDLHPVPSENLHPVFPDDYTKAPVVDPARHYLKAPSFTYEDSEPGQTFVADCLLNEASVLEKLKRHPHANVAEFYGCVVDRGRITRLCLKRYKCSLAVPELCLSTGQREQIFADVISGVKHLHDLGLVHNDIGPGNICIDADGRAVIVDFDSCLPFGEKLLKGSAAAGVEQISDVENDFCGLDDLDQYLDGLPKADRQMTRIDS